MMAYRRKCRGSISGRRFKHLVEYYDTLARKESPATSLSYDEDQSQHSDAFAGIRLEPLAVVLHQQQAGLAGDRAPLEARAAGRLAKRGWRRSPQALHWPGAAIGGPRRNQGRTRRAHGGPQARERQQVVSRGPGARSRGLRGAGGRGPCAARRERCGQVDADQDRLGRLPARRRQHADRRQACALRPAGRCPGGRHRHDLPGAAAVPRAQRRREHFPRSRPAHAAWHARLARDAGRRPRAARLARDPRPRCRTGRGRALGRQPAAHRDRQGALAQRPHPDHGRADRRR